MFKRKDKFADPTIDDKLIGHDGKEYNAWSGNYVPPVDMRLGLIFWVVLIAFVLSLAISG